MKRTKKKDAEKMHYSMIIKNNFAIARAKGFESAITMPVSYAYKHMEDVSKIGKSEGITIVWEVIFE